MHSHDESLRTADPNTPAILIGAFDATVTTTTTPISQDDHHFQQSGRIEFGGTGWLGKRVGRTLSNWSRNSGTTPKVLSLHCAHSHTRVEPLPTGELCDLICLARIR